MLTLVHKLNLSSLVIDSDADSPRGRSASGADSPRGRNNLESPRGRNIDSPRGKSFSWSFVTRSTGSSPGRNNTVDGFSTTSQSSADSISESRSSTSSSTSTFRGSDSSLASPRSVLSSPRSKLIRSLFSSGKSPKARKPALLDKMPFGKRSEYLTVYVGVRIEQSEKFVVSRRLLDHPLIRVLMQCSEDEFGEDYTDYHKRGLAIVCDPALFVEVVKAVDDEMCGVGPEKNVLGGKPRLSKKTGEIYFKFRKNWNKESVSLLSKIERGLLAESIIFLPFANSCIDDVEIGEEFADVLIARACDDVDTMLLRRDLFNFIEDDPRIVRWQILHLRLISNGAIVGNLYKAFVDSETSGKGSEPREA
ncbi:hypothetical protein R1sor_004244 [Riccia sorocarpa]|uniref:Uncharacterized protein n=1 Tax=Riccia sorocarpa TaxID=122646 RepID=A0ABD3H3Y7_9MARC